MRYLWNTFNSQAAWLAGTLALAVALYVGAGLQLGYRSSAWWSAMLHSPMFAFGLYVYFAVAFNAARLARSWIRVLGLVAWLVLGAVVPYFLGYGLILLITVLGVAVPELTYLPIGLGSFEVAIHITWLGFLAALVVSCLLVGRSSRQSSVRREGSDA